MQLALRCLWSEPIGFWKLDNLLCYWLEQEPRRQDWLSPGPLSTVAARVYFLVIAVEWSLFVISFSAWDPLLFFRIVVCIVREPCEFSQRLGCRGPNAPVHKNRSWPAKLAWSCAASSSLWVWFCLLYLREGRQVDSAVTCECSHDGLSCLSDKRAPAGATKGLSAFPVAKGDL